MAKFGSAGSLKLRDTGEPADCMALVGSAFDVALVYLDANGDPSSLADWTLSASGAFHMAEWTDDDKLVEIVSPRITEPVVLAAEPMRDQRNNPGVFLFSLSANIVPTHLRDIPSQADLVPTLAVWVRLQGPNGVVDQARLAVGFRRGSPS